jgi:lysozyme
MSVRWIDISDHQAVVDWSSVARAGIGFAFVKASEGGPFTARTFGSHWGGAREAHLVRGAYHFFRALDDPRAQADHFLRTVNVGPDDLPPALDLEVRDGVDVGTFNDRVLGWLDTVKAATNRKPLIYASPSFVQSFGSPRALSAYPLCIAHYDHPAPTIPRGWATYTFWQYTSKGNVPGIKGVVDLNTFNGSASDLTAFIAGGIAPTVGRVSDAFVYEGDTGHEVELIQSLLRAKEFDPGSIDGGFGPRTKGAVIAFQRANGLIVDGVVGPQT